MPVHKTSYSNFSHLFRILLKPIHIALVIPSRHPNYPPLIRSKSPFNCFSSGRSLIIAHFHLAGSSGDPALWRKSRQSWWCERSFRLWWYAPTEVARTGFPSAIVSLPGWRPPVLTQLLSTAKVSLRIDDCMHACRNYRKSASIRRRQSSAVFCSKGLITLGNCNCRSQKIIYVLYSFF